MGFNAAAGGGDLSNDNPMGDETVPVNDRGPVYGSNNVNVSVSYRRKIPGSVQAILPPTEIGYCRYVLDCGMVSLPEGHQGGMVSSRQDTLPAGFDPHVHCIPAPKRG